MVKGTEDGAILGYLESAARRDGGMGGGSLRKEAPTNSIVAYLSRVGESRLLSREEEQALAIAMEEGARETFDSLVRIPFCRDALLTLPRRIAAGEIALQDIATLEESTHEDWTPSLTAELDVFCSGIEKIRRRWSRACRRSDPGDAALKRLSAELCVAYGDFRFGAGIVRVVVKTLKVQLDRIVARDKTPDPEDRTDTSAFGTFDVDRGVIVGAASKADAEKILGLNGKELARAVDALFEAQRKVHSARSRMIRSNLRLVVSIAKHYMNRGMPLLDLIQEGNIGLMKAVSRFDWRLGHKFSTYATWWIRQSISRSLAEHSRTIRVPVHLVECMSKVSRTRVKLYHDLGREPTTKEVSEAAGFTVEQVERAQKVLVRTVSLEAPLGDDDGELKDVVEDEHASSPFEEAVGGDMSKAVRRLLASLTPKEEAVIRLRYGIGAKREHTLEEVGDAVGLTRERVRQIEAKALARLRFPAMQRDMLSFL